MYPFIMCLKTTVVYNINMKPKTTGCKETHGCNSKSKCYNYEGGLPLFCGDHRLDDMINVKVKRCVECNTIARFGFSKDSVERCGVHRKPGMKNYKSRHCEKCDKIPSFGFPGKTARFCGSHYEEGMIDVCNPICDVKDCPTRASFGVSGKKA